MPSMIGYHELNPVPDSHLLALNPVAHLVFGTLIKADETVKRARYVKSLLPNTKVIMRLWPDDMQSSKMTPNQWIQTYAKYGGQGIILMADNEPDMSGDVRTIARWYERLLDLAGPMNIPLCVGVFSTGNPHHEKYGELLPMFRGLDKWKAVGNIWGPHAYYDPKDPAHRDWQIYRHLTYGYKVCDDNGLSRPDTVFTEVGIAVDYNPKEGWRALAGLNGAAYAKQLFAFKLPVPILIFAYGDDGNWTKFNVGDAPDFQNELVLEAGKTPDPGTGPAPGTGTGTGPDMGTGTPSFPALPAASDSRWVNATQIMPGPIRVRKLPVVRDDTLTGVDLMQNDAIKIIEAVRFVDSAGEWIAVQAKGVVGWSRRPPAQFQLTPVVDPGTGTNPGTGTGTNPGTGTGTTPTNPVGLTAAEITQLRQLQTRATQLHSTIRDAQSQLDALYQQIDALYKKT